MTYTLAGGRHFTFSSWDNTEEKADWRKKRGKICKRRNLQEKCIAREILESSICDPIINRLSFARSKLSTVLVKQDTLCTEEAGRKQRADNRALRTAASASSSYQEYQEKGIRDVRLTISATLDCRVVEKSDGKSEKETTSVAQSLSTDLRKDKTKEGGEGAREQSLCEIAKKENTRLEKRKAEMGNICSALKPPKKVTRSVQNTSNLSLLETKFCFEFPF